MFRDVKTANSTASSSSELPTFNILCGRPPIERLLLHSLQANGFRFDLHAAIVLLIDAPFAYALQQLETLDQTGRHVIIQTPNLAPEYWDDIWELQPAILLAGDAFNREVETALVDAGYGKRYKRTPNIVSPLTTCERSVLHYAARDYSNKEIAAQLNIRPQTVANMLRTVYAKLGVRGRMGAAFYYWGRSDLVDKCCKSSMV